MKFLADQDVYRVTIDFLKDQEHDVITARKISMHRASDQTLLRKGKELDRIVLTRDKDFGALVFLEGELSSGVILLRGEALNIDGMHRELKILLDENEEKRLHRSFCVVEPDKYRIRYLA